MKNSKSKHVAIIGSGMGSLSAAALLVKDGFKVTVIEQNYLPGGCTSSYYRKGYIFEAGATTLVGLDEGMPLDYVLKKTGIHLNAIQLELPMQVRLKDGSLIHRYPSIEQWIKEAERVFGKKNQRKFWEKCYKISQKVWKVSVKQKSFPPNRLSDFIGMLKNFELNQLSLIPKAFQTVSDFLKETELDSNQSFVNFINEQLLITAQNHADEVNMLFGATALCYTNFGNYYVPGGLINLVNPFVQYIKHNGGEVLMKTKVQKINHALKGYSIKTDKGDLEADIILSGIPLNNMSDLFDDESLERKIKKHTLPSAQLRGAFTMGVGLTQAKNLEVLHKQIHLTQDIGIPGAKSIFISYNHTSDTSRAPEHHSVASISTHVYDPANCTFNKDEVAKKVLNFLVEIGEFETEAVAYYHSSSPQTWQDWTLRKFGFVGGYPQYKRIKPWQMAGSRFGKGIYVCGDSVYPGQGIPGVCLSGIISAHKIKTDNQ
jgi:C-3',4' desaturase CrtD